MRCDLSKLLRGLHGPGMCARAGGGSGSGRASCTHALPPASALCSLVSPFIAARRDDGNAINQNNRALSHVFMNECAPECIEFPRKAQRLQVCCCRCGCVRRVLSSVKICYNNLSDALRELLHPTPIRCGCRHFLALATPAFDTFIWPV